MKSIIAVLGGISAWGMTAASDNSITTVELFGLLGALATALGVYAIPNTPPKGDTRDPDKSETRALRPGEDLGFTTPDVVIAVLCFVAGLLVAKVFLC
jgi:hypothetical protein